MERNRKGRRPLFRLGVLSVCFLAGAVCGQALASGMPETAAAELRRYLSDRLRGDGLYDISSAVLPTALLYLRYPALAAVLGFTSVGGLLLCVTAAVFGFLLSFSIGCFTAAYGEGGILLAAAVLGIRCLVTIPCFFLLAVPAMGTSASLLRLTLGGRRVIPEGEARLSWLGICAAVLLAGICADLVLTPRLLHWAMKRILG